MNFETRKKEFFERLDKDIKDILEKSLEEKNKISKIVNEVIYQ